MIDRSTEALSLLRQMLNWELTSENDPEEVPRWQADEQTLLLNERGELLWKASPRDGGPVRIHLDTDLSDPSLEEIVELCLSLRSIKEMVQGNGPERADYEDEVREAAISLLRRKSAEGLKLVSVVSEPINARRFANVLAEVTFEVDGPQGRSRSTFTVGDAEELQEQFEDLIQQARAAAK